MKKSSLARAIVTYVVLVGSCLVAVFPVLWIALSSFKHEVDADAPATHAFTFTPTLVNYTALFQSPSFIRAGVTTLVITFCVTAIVMVVAMLTAYAFARTRVRGRRLLTSLLVMVQVVPEIVLLIPYYKIVSALGLFDRWVTLIVILSVLATPFATWLMLSFIQNSPIEIEESAIMDGASRFQLLVHIILPLMAPGLAAGAIFTSIGAWNTFMMPIILGQSRSLTLTAYTANFISQQQLLWAQLCASSMVILAPIVIFALALQRPLIRGITAGSLKG